MSSTKESKKETEGQDLAARFAEQELRIAEQERRLAELRAQLARGTGNITEQAARVTLPERMQKLLRARPRGLEELARELSAPAGRVSSILRGLKKHLYNAGSAERPEWFWIVGDDCTPQDLYAAVEALMRHRPIAHAELVTATGARENRVSGAINEMRRTKRVVNVGDGRARWFIVPEGVQLARLTRKPVH